MNVMLLDSRVFQLELLADLEIHLACELSFQEENAYEHDEIRCVHDYLVKSIKNHSY